MESESKWTCHLSCSVILKCPYSIPCDWSAVSMECVESPVGSCDDVTQCDCVCVPYAPSLQASCQVSLEKRFKPQQE